MKKVLSFLFWWPILLVKVLRNKTAAEKVNIACSLMSAAFLLALISVDKGNIWAAVAVYVVLGFFPSKENFWIA